MLLKVKLLYMFAGSLAFAFHFDQAHGKAWQRSVLEDDCDFDFKEQPEDFYSMVSALANKIFRIF